MILDNPILTTFTAVFEIMSISRSFINLITVFRYFMIASFLIFMCACDLRQSQFQNLARQDQTHKKVKDKNDEAIFRHVDHYHRSLQWSWERCDSPIIDLHVQNLPRQFS